MCLGCSPEPETGPVEIRWDREVCARCGMAISDHRFAAQVRGGPSGEPTRVWKFDDIGCALLWLDERPWREEPRVEVWVADHRDGHWIEARRAWFLPAPHSPMGYNLAAQEIPALEGVDFDRARERIREVERNEHQHRGDQPPEPGY